MPITTKVLPATPKRVEIIPEILAPAAFRDPPHNIVGRDLEWPKRHIATTKQIAMSPGVGDIPIPQKVKEWCEKSYTLGPFGNLLFEDVDGDGKCVWEDWASGNIWMMPAWTWVSATGNNALHHRENLDSGVTHEIQCGDGKETWRSATEGADFEAADFGNGQRESKGPYNGVIIRYRILVCKHKGQFLRVKLSQDF